MASLTREDGILLQRLQAGDAAAFKTIYDNHWQELLRFACKKVQVEDVAQDMVQDIFVSLWQRRAVLNLEQSVRSYLFAALKYKILDFIAANVTRRHYADTLLRIFQPAIASTDQAVQAQETQALLNDAANALPDKMREIFDLSRHEGYSTSEIAHHLNISEQTVKNQLSTALKRLRARLGDHLSLWLL